MKKTDRAYRFLVYMLPAVLFFSYWPVIRLGASESMNFELSLPLIWLVIFDVVACGIMIKKKMLFKDCKKMWAWMLFPIFATLSVLWSMNFLRGLLTAGILWFIYFAGYAFWNLRSLFSGFGFKEKFWKVFFVSSLVACGWCFLQCVLDLAGVPRETSLMCAGCTYEMFGFPHPNGFAIEPQFMGNLLLAPAIISGWLITGPGNIFHLRPRPSGPSPRADGANSRAAALRNAASLKYNCHPLLAISMFFVFAATIFLTFSRGAIYAFVVAMIFMVVMEGMRQKSWKVCKTFIIIVVAFLFTLNLQGIMAEVSSTNDTYATGVAKVLNHLSLGIIDVRSQNEEISSEETEALASEKTDEKSEEVEREAVFDGYVAESTDTRVRLTGAAIEVWKKDFKTVMLGVGLGGAGQALYVNGLSPAPKEIVQNEYASLLLETGLVGIVLLILTIVLIIRVMLKSRAASMLLALVVAYGVTLLFFSGLPNALQIYLLPAIFISLCGKSSYRK